MTQQMKRAFVLHRRPFRNTSLLVELFAEGAGRFPVVIRGGANKSQGLIQPFVPLRASWAGRGEVKSIHQIEPDDYQLATLQGKKLFCALYLNELLMRLMPRFEAYDPLFALYIRTLSRLSDSGSPEWPLRQFELGLLQETGYELSLRSTIDQQPIDGHLRYRYQHGDGFALTTSEVATTFSGQTLIALQNQTCDDDNIRQEAKQLLRSIIDYHLDYKPLKSRELFR